MILLLVCLFLLQHTRKVEIFLSILILFPEGWRPTPNKLKRAPIGFKCLLKHNVLPYFPQWLLLPRLFQKYRRFFHRQPVKLDSKPSLKDMDWKWIGKNSTISNLWFLFFYKGSSIPTDIPFIRKFILYTGLEKLNLYYYMELWGHFLKNRELGSKLTPKNENLPEVLSRFWLHQSLNGTLETKNHKIDFLGQTTTSHASRKFSTVGFDLIYLGLEWWLKRIEDEKSRHLGSRFQKPWTLKFWENKNTSVVF